MNIINPDPEKYKELSKPFESQAEAEKITAEFFNAVRRLREQYKIPELIIQFQVYVKTDDGVSPMIGGGGWGNQLLQAKLAKRSADLEMEHLFALMENLIDARPRLVTALLTDPSSNKE